MFLGSTVCHHDLYQLVLLKASLLLLLLDTPVLQDKGGIGIMIAQYCGDLLICHPAVIMPAHIPNPQLSHTLQYVHDTEIM
jgi:hypothetical protein